MMKINKTNVICFVITIATLIVLQLTGIFGWIKNIRKARLVFAYEKPMFIVGAVVIAIIILVIMVKIETHKRKR